MKVLVITGSRADRNGLEVVHEALLKAGHQSRMMEWGTSELHCCQGVFSMESNDIAVVGGDRHEMLCAALALARLHVPIAHIAGGDVTRGSADDRYRDAITALACVHFASTRGASNRLMDCLSHPGDVVLCTGSPAIDRIMQTPVNPDRSDVLSQFCMRGDKPVALVCVHPNTVGDNPHADFRAVITALGGLDLQCIFLGANADNGGDDINKWLAAECANHIEPMWSFHHTVSPQMYYSLMTHCDVMVGNSSAMLYEAPVFAIPCVMVGQRQLGRIIPDCVYSCPEDLIATPILARQISLACGTRANYEAMPRELRSPYGDGKSAPRIVKALEQWYDKTRAKSLSAVG